MAWTEREKVQRLLQHWANATSLLTIAFSAWAVCYAGISQQWPHEDVSASRRMELLFLIAAAVCLAACAFELMAVLVEFSVQSLPSQISTDDNKIMLVLCCVLGANYCIMPKARDLWIRTDRFSFGGPRPVYTLRYVERSICLTLLYSIASGRAQHPTEAPHGSRLKEGRNLVTAQIWNFLSIPLVISRRLGSMQTAASTRCTVVYTWCSWLAVVIEDEFARWVLINVTFVAYVVATLEQAGHAFLVYRFDNSVETAVLFAAQPLISGLYMVISLLAVCGWVAWQDEQLIYTCLDIAAKLMLSGYLSSMKRKRTHTLLKKMQDSASRITEDIQRLVSHASVPIFSVGQNLQITEWNMKISEITGISRQEALAMYLPDALSTEGTAWQNAGQPLLLDALAGNDGEVLELDFASRAGTGQQDCQEPGYFASGKKDQSHCSVVVSATCQRDPHGKVVGVLCMGQDVTQIRKARNAAQAVAECLSLLLDCANAPIIEIESDYRIVWWNTWMAQRIGVPAMQIKGKHLGCFATSPSWEHSLRRAMLMDQEAATLEVEAFELCFMDLEERPKVLLMTPTPRAALGMSEARTGVICFGQDITMQRGFIQRKASLMQVVSNRLKVPMEELIGLAQKSIDEVTESIYQRSFHMINNCAKRLYNMVSSINSIAELTRDKPIQLVPGRVQLQTIIEEVMLLCEKSMHERTDKATAGLSGTKSKIKLINKVKAPLPVIEADEHRCTQLIYNLVANAVKFTHEGVVECDASFDDTRQEVTVHVKDTGIGVAEDQIWRIFEPFDQEDISESRRYKGLGLGLAICREIARKHGGDVTADSVKGQGSTFSVTLPYQMAMQTEQASGSQEDGPSARRLGPEDEEADIGPAVLAWRKDWMLTGASELMPTSTDTHIVPDSDDDLEPTFLAESPAAPLEFPLHATAKQEQSNDPGAERIALVTETTKKLEMYRKEAVAAQDQAAQLEKRIEELKQQIAEQTQKSNEKREQRAWIKQCLWQQQQLGRQQSQLRENFQKLANVQQRQRKLLYTKEAGDVDAFSTCRESAAASTQDPELREVTKFQANCQGHLQRLADIAQSLQSSEGAKLMQLATDFAEHQTKLQADLGQKNYFLRVRQERLSNASLLLCQASGSSTGPPIAPWFSDPGGGPDGATAVHF